MLKEKFEKLDDAVLWGLLADISNTLKAHPYSTDDALFMFWYEIFKSLEHEINRRLSEGET